MKRLAVFLLFVILVISGCSKPGEDFVGEWVDTKYKNIVMTIEVNGDSFIIRRAAPSFRDGKIETKNIPATFENGTLKVNSGFRNVDLIIDEKTGLLTDGEREYKKR